MWPFDWHIYISPLSILKVMVKVMLHISTVRILQTVINKTNISIANTFKVACGLTIGIFKQLK